MDNNSQSNDFHFINQESKDRLIELEKIIATMQGYALEAENTKATLAKILEAAQTTFSDIRTLATTALSAKTQINDDQAVIATKSTHIQSAQEHADKVRAELDRVMTNVMQVANEAEGHKSRAQSSNDTAAELLSEIKAGKISADADFEAVAEAKESAKQAAETTKNLAKKSEVVEERIQEYENRLAQLEKACQNQLKTITGLLPGATAAGLAHAFDDRRKTFLNPSTQWQKLFVGSVVAIIVLAISGIWGIYKQDSIPSWDDLARMWMTRLPIAGALVWLAIHSSREAALAKRLEEDYGYKAAVAASFLGFQQQMADIGQKASSGSPLSKLCEDTLSTLACPPGRIYEKHKLTITPASELANAASNALKLDKSK